MKTTYLKPVLDLAATGAKIKTVMKDKGITARELQIIMDFPYVQTIYNWFAGKNMPGIELWYKKINFGYEPLPAFTENHKKSAVNDLSIVFPEQGANLIIPVEIDGKDGAMVMQAACRDPSRTVYWDLDGEFLGMTRHYHDMAVTPRAGKHTLTLSDSNGTVVSRTFTIVADDDE